MSNKQPGIYGLLGWVVIVGVMVGALCLITASFMIHTIIGFLTIGIMSSFTAKTAMDEMEKGDNQ